MSTHSTATRLLVATIDAELSAQGARLELHGGDEEIAMLGMDYVPGNVVVEGEGLPRMEVSFGGLIERLAALPNRLGARAVADALRVRPGDGRLLPYPRNVPGRVQVGDTVMGPSGTRRVSVVAALTVPGPAGTEIPLLSVPRGAYAIAHLEGRDGRPGGTVEAEDIQRVGATLRGDRSDVRRLRRFRAQVDRLYAERVSAVRNGAGWDDGLVRLCTLRSAALSVLREAACPPASPASGTRALLRTRRRHLAELHLAIALPLGHTVGEMALLDLVEGEANDVSAMIRALHVRRGAVPSPG